MTTKASSTASIHSVEIQTAGGKRPKLYCLKRKGVSTSKANPAQKILTVLAEPPSTEKAVLQRKTLELPWTGFGFISPDESAVEGERRNLKFFSDWSRDRFSVSTWKRLLAPMNAREKAPVTELLSITYPRPHTQLGGQLGTVGRSPIAPFLGGISTEEDAAILGSRQMTVREMCANSRLGSVRGLIGLTRVEHNRYQRMGQSN